MNDIDVKKLERTFLEVEAQLLAQNRIIDSLRDENLHLRQVIEMLITSQTSQISR